MGAEWSDHATGPGGWLPGRLRRWLGLEPNIRVMLTTTLLVGLGEELWRRFVPAYLAHLGASVWGIALYGTLHDLLRASARYPGGWIADRVGRGTALVLCAVLAISGCGVAWGSSSWAGVLVGTLVAMAWASVSLPTFFAIIGDSLPPTRRAIGFGVQSVLTRIPIVLAAPIGGWCIAGLGMAAGMRVGLGLTIVLALVALSIVRRFYVEPIPAPPDTARFGTIWRAMDGELKRLLIADTLARWARGLPQVFVVLYVLQVLRVDAFHFGLLTSVQMLTAMVLAIPVAKLADRLPRQPFVVATFACFALFPVALVQARTTSGVVLAFILAGCREIGEPARKAMIVDLAPLTVRGRVVGMYYLLRGLAVFPASLVGGWLWGLRPQWVFYLACGLGVAGCLVYGRGTRGVHTRLLPRRRGPGEGGEKR